jgi:carbonic anhydrase
VQKLVHGVHHFQNTAFSSHRELFERLSRGQNPETMFITCSDSRINPNLLTSTGPGDLFILRNAGNLIPPEGSGWGSELATIEYAVAALGVHDIIVCGHTDCGAINALLEPDSVQALPAMGHWLQHASDTRHIVLQNYPELTGQAQQHIAVQENVLVQLDHLRTHPAVAARLEDGTLHLHGWVYHLGTGKVFAYDIAEDEFLPITSKPFLAAGPPQQAARPI